MEQRVGVSVMLGAVGGATYAASPAFSIRAAPSLSTRRLPPSPEAAPTVILYYGRCFIERRHDDDWRARERGLRMYGVRAELGGVAVTRAVAMRRDGGVVCRCR